MSIYKAITVNLSLFIDFLIKDLHDFFISLLDSALFVPIESSTRLVSVRNDGEGGVTIANERPATLITSNERTEILTSDQSESKDDAVPGVWVGATRVSLIAATTLSTFPSEICENHSQELSFQRQQKMIFGMAFGMYDFYASLGKSLMLLCVNKIS